MAPPVENLAALSLDEIARLVESRALPPVERWAPSRTGESDIRIAADGRWFHQGDPITRQNMVRLFSTILRREPDGRHVLVTPAEKLFVTVDDTPFLAVEMKVEGEGRGAKVAFRLNTGDLVLLGPEHPLLPGDGAAQPAPRLVVRGGLEARLSRSLYYEVAEFALEQGEAEPGLWSGGHFFPIGMA